MAKATNAFAALMGKATALDKTFTTSNPNRETTLPDGVYYAILKRLSGRSIGKANEEQHPAVGLEGHFLSTKEGEQEGVYGQGFSSIFMFKETEKQTLADAFSRFVYFLQDALGIDTSDWSIRKLPTYLDELNAMLGQETVVVQVTVKLGDNGRKNVNVANRGVTEEELAEIGVDLSALGELPSNPDEGYAPDEGEGEGEVEGEAEAGEVEGEAEAEGEYAEGEAEGEEAYEEAEPEPEPEPVRRPAAKKAAVKQAVARPVTRPATPPARPAAKQVAKKAAVKQAIRRPVR